MNTLRSINPLRAFAVTAAVVAALLFASAGPVSAHAVLLSSDPTDGQTLDEAPEQVVLEFSEELDLPSTQVALVTPGGETVELPALTVDGNVLIQEVSFPEVGTYTFSFRIVSADGHPVEDSIEFTVTSVPQQETPAVEETEDSPAAEVADSGEGVGWGTVGLIAAVVVVILVGGGLFLARMTRRRT